MRVVRGVMAGSHRCRTVLTSPSSARCATLYRVEDSGSTPAGSRRHRQRPHRQGTRFQFRPGHDALPAPGQHRHRPFRAHVSAQHLRISGFHRAPATKAGIGQSLLVGHGGRRRQRARNRLADLRAGPRLCGGRKRRARCAAWSASRHRGGDRAIEHVQQWIGGRLSYWAHTGFKTGLWSPLIVAGPSIAGVIAKRMDQGSGAADPVRTHQGHRRARRPRAQRPSALKTSSTTASCRGICSIQGPAAAGQRHHQTGNGGDTRRRGPRPRDQSRAYISDRVQGPPTSRRGGAAAQVEGIVGSS